MMEKLDTSTMAFLESEIEMIRKKKEEIDRLINELNYELELLERAITIHRKEDHT